MSRTEAAEGQQELFSMADVEADAQAARIAAAGRPLCMFDHPARGIAARNAAFLEWAETYGHSGCAVRSHAWIARDIGYRAEGYDPTTERCQAIVLTCDTCEPWPSADRAEWPDCGCIDRYNALLWRGACTGCPWEGPIRPGLGGENPAAEDAMDHAWTGWREAPIVPRWPSERKAQQRWIETVVPQYPAGWLENGGPIRTWRSPSGTRHHPEHFTRFGGGGWDMGVVRPEAGQ